MTKHPSLFKTTAWVTLHCLTGCSIGEVIGLMIGVWLQIGPWGTMGLATGLAFISGMGLAIWPLMRQQQLSLPQALKTIWLGEVISITVMELAMNATDYFLGGASAMSLSEPLFWTSLIAAFPAGYIAASPVNLWMLKRHMKRFHH